jgi:hypothetical protein
MAQFSCLLVIDCPRGYPELAAFVQSNAAFMLYRRFGFLQARLLLNKQDQLRDLEQQLDDQDKKDANLNNGVLMNREQDEAQNGPRIQLLKDTERTFEEYGGDDKTA